MQILSRWRSWEISNIQESYFFKWLSGETDKEIKVLTSTSIEGVVFLEKGTAHFDVGDGKGNVLNIHHVVVNCTERPEAASPVSATNVVGVDISCQSISVTAGSDVVDLVSVVTNQRTSHNEDVLNTADQEPPSTSPAPMIEYRGAVLIDQIEFSGHIAALGLTMATEDLRVSAFSRLRRDDEFISPSFNLSFQRIKLAVLEKSYCAAQLHLDRFSAQMLTLNQRPGIAASLGSIALRLSKPLPWLITQGSEAVYRFSSNLEISSDTEVSHPGFQKPNLPTVTFRLHKASVETWLVPDALLLNLSSSGLQAVLGELSDNHQWIFLDVPPATISLSRAINRNVKLANIATPFIAVHTLIQWQDKLCKIDPNIQIGTLSLSMTSLATLFSTLASEPVISQLTECQQAVDDARKRLAISTSVKAPVEPTEPLLTVSYRVRSKWESIQVVADTPEAKILFTCSDIYISLSNRSNKPNQSERILFTAGSQNTTLSLLSEDIPDKLSVLDLHWEIGNSVTTDESGNVLYRLYLVSNAFVITLSPRSIFRVSRALRHVVQDVERLEIRQTLKDLNIRTTPVQSPNDEVAPVDEDADPFQAMKNVDALRVSFSKVKLKWIADDHLEDSHGFTFQCKKVDASVLDRATRGRFVVQEGEIELNCRKTKISSNFARLPKLDFNVQRRTEADGWQLQLDAHGDTVQVNITPACIETGHAVLESISMAAADLREEFPADNTAHSVNPLASHAILEQTKKLKAVITSIDFSGARINAQYDKGFKPTAYMSKYRVQGDGCDVGAMQIPGLALRSRYSRKPRHVFHAELCILESSNVLSPQIKPFIHDLLHRIERVLSRREAVFHDNSDRATHESVPSSAAILGDLKFSVGLRVQSQELTLSCDPFSKVDAKVGVDEIYATLISCKTANHSQTFAMTVTMSGAHLSLQHQYSGIASANIKLKDLSLNIFSNIQMRSVEPGISAILKSSAFEVSLNARQGISST